MTVIAFCTPESPSWRWRIVDYTGDPIEESEATYASIGGAVAAGARRLERMQVFERSLPPSAYPRGVSHPRPR